MSLGVVESWSRGVSELQKHVVKVVILIKRTVLLHDIKTRLLLFSTTSRLICFTTLRITYLTTSLLPYDRFNLFHMIQIVSGFKMHDMPDGLFTPFLMESEITPFLLRE